MIRLEETIEVPGEPGRCFAYASDFGNIEQWDPGILESEKMTAGPPRVGTAYRLVALSGAMRIPMKYVIREYDPPGRVVLEGEGRALHALDTIVFEPWGQGTRITYTADLTFRGFLGSLEPVMEASLRQVGRRAVEGLRSALSEERPVPEGRGINSLKDRLILPGLLDFTRGGYRRGRKRWTPLAVDLSGRTMVVTGATSGLGRAAAERLARMGARVILVGRDREKTEAARREIVGETGSERVVCRVADLSLLSQVRELAKALGREPAIHVLINNAGALFNERALTAEGIERTLAVDLLAPFLLTNLLMPKLQASRPARIVNVSSGGMYTQKVRVDDLQYEEGRYNGSVAYARAKRALVILTEMWGQRLEGSGVVAHAMHPGWADTPGVAASLPAFYRVTRRVLRTPAEGADTVVWLAASGQAGRCTGRFWLDRQPRTTHVFPGTRETSAERERLWSALEKLCG